MTLYRVAAFTTTPEGGNPAGVHIADKLPGAAEMQRIAADVGYSETAFLAPSELGGYVVRYYSPQAEVPFCGHATIASGTVLGQLNGAGTYLLQSSVGEIPVVVTNGDGGPVAELTSVTPSHELADETLVSEASAILGWNTQDLDPEIAPAVIYAGARHLLLALRRRETLAAISAPRILLMCPRRSPSARALTWDAPRNSWSPFRPAEASGSRDPQFRLRLQLAS